MSVDCILNMHAEALSTVQALYGVYKNILLFCININYMEYTVNITIRGDILLKDMSSIVADII